MNKLYHGNCVDIIGDTMKIIGIYCIRHVVRGICYVGQSIDIERRFRDHKREKSDEQKGCVYLSSAIGVYGADAFDWEVLELCEESELNDRECHWIASLDCVKPNGFNLTYGGGGGRPSEETKKRISKGMRGKKKSWEHQVKINQALLGRDMSVMRGDNNPAKRPEVRNKISAALKGKKKSEEHVKKISEARQGEKSHNWGKGKAASNMDIIFYLLNLGWTHRRIAKYFGVSQAAISKLIERRSSDNQLYLFDNTEEA